MLQIDSSKNTNFRAQGAEYGIYHESQDHYHGKSFNPLFFFEIDLSHAKALIFEESEPSFNLLLPFIVA